MVTLGMQSLTTSWQRPVTHRERRVCGHDLLQSHGFEAGGGDSGRRSCARAQKAPGGALKGAEVWLVLTLLALATLATLRNLSRVNYKAGNVIRKDLLGTQLPAHPDAWTLIFMF